MKKIPILAVLTILIANILTGCIQDGEEEIQTIPPEPTFTHSPLNPKVNGEIIFDATSSTDLDGIITSYQWDFGDNSSGVGDIVTHTYTMVGTYTVTLTITDSDNLMNVTSKEITISKKTIGTYYFSSNRLVPDIPPTGEKQFQIKPSETEGQTYQITEPLDIKVGEWEATLHIKSPFALGKAKLIAKTATGEELGTMDSTIKLFRWNRETTVEISENFAGGEVATVDLFFVGWAPTAWVLNTTIVTFLYGEDYQSFITFR